MRGKTKMEISLEDRLAIVMNIELQIAIIKDLQKQYESMGKDLEKIIGLAENAESIITN